MATDIVLRSIKAAALTHAEMDQNWESLAQTIDSQTVNYTILTTDQNKIIEANISSGTITLPTVASAAGIDTDSFRITIKNINASNLTLTGNGAETIDGAGGITLFVNECVTLSLSANAAEWTVIAVHGPNLTGISSTAAEINYNAGVTLGTALANKVMTTDASNNFSSTGTVQATTVNASTTLQIAGASVTASAAELNVLNGNLASTAELNVLNGNSASTTELNYLVGVTSLIQNQFSNKQPLDADLTAIAALLNTDSNFIVGNGTAWVAESGATARTSLGVDAAGTDNSTNVSLAGTPNYLALTGQVITRGLINLASHITGILPIANGGTASSTASGARTSLGVDAAGTDNSTNVSLAGTPNYITIAGQVITRALINLTSHITGLLPIANGGTAASTASGARTNLGLVELSTSLTAAATYHYITTVDTANLYRVLSGNRMQLIGPQVTSYTKATEYIIPVDGTYRIITSVKADAGTAYVRIYKNGVAFGTESSTTSTSVYTDLTEDLTFSANDLIQVYTYQTVGGTYGASGTFRIQIGSNMYAAIDVRMNTTYGNTTHTLQIV